MVSNLGLRPVLGRLLMLLPLRFGCEQLLFRIRLLGQASSLGCDGFVKEHLKLKHLRIGLHLLTRLQLLLSDPGSSSAAGRSARLPGGGFSSAAGGLLGVGAAANGATSWVVTPSAASSSPASSGPALASSTYVVDGATNPLRSPHDTCGQATHPS